MENLEKMIFYLSKYKYKRDPYLYATVAKLKTKNMQLYKLLAKNNPDVYLRSIDDINNLILENIIKSDNVDEFWGEPAPQEVAS